MAGAGRRWQGGRSLRAGRAVAPRPPRAEDGQRAESEFLRLVGEIALDAALNPSTPVGNKKPRRGGGAKANL